MDSPNLKIKIKCLEIDQPIGKYYVGVMNHGDLIHISFADVRRLESKKNEEGFDSYIGIQRTLSTPRVNEIGKYVNLVDATFPTGIILAISSKDVSYSSETHEMIITRNHDVARVLDGQHRIAGLERYKGSHDKFQLNVVIFVDMELEDQAVVFATINKTQTKVNKSLVADLFEFATTRSPQKTAHNIARALNEKKGSPFFEKIKILGVASEKSKETITQATFVEYVVDYITADQVKDRDLLRRGKSLPKVSAGDLRRRFFRNMFIDEKDADIAQVLWNYFNAVYQKWPDAWGEGHRAGLILNKSTGFVALMKFLRDAYLSINKLDTVPTASEFLDIFERIDIPSADFTKIKYIPGGVGQSELYKDLLKCSKLNAHL